MVNPQSNEYLNVIELNDGQENYKLQVEGGVAGIKEVPIQATTIRLDGGGPGRYSSDGNDFASAEQRTMIGGRGGEYFIDDPTKFYDSRFGWTLSDAVFHPTPLWKFPSYIDADGGIREAHTSLSADKKWEKITGDNVYLSSTFTVGAGNLSADNVHLWLQKVGQPADLTVEIWSDSGGNPSAIVTSATDSVSRDDFPDMITEYWGFDLSAASDLTASTAYHVVVYASATDNDSNHWLIATDTAGSSKNSTDGSTWSSAGFGINYRVSDTAVKRRMLFFEMEGGSYFVDKKDDGTASQLFLLGDRGIATAGTSTTLTDSNSGLYTSWTTNMWADAWVKIVKGTGVGQNRKIASNTSTALTVETAFDITPSTDSEYVIYNTPYHVEIGSTGLDSVTDVEVVNNIAFFAQGQSDYIRRMRWNSGTPGHDFADDSTNTADHLLSFVDANGVRIINATNASDATLEGAEVEAWGTDLDFADAQTVNCGESTYNITNAFVYNGVIYIAKENEIGIIQNNIYRKLNVNLAGFTESKNGFAVLPAGEFIYFGWVFSLQRMFNQVIEDIPTYLPDDRGGYVSSISAHPYGVFFTIDAGDNGTSGAYFYDGRGVHEVWRAWATGKRIRSSYFQANEDTKRWLWIECDGELIYMEFPRGTGAINKDDTQEYHHEMIVISPTVDYGNVARPKAFKELEANIDNLNNQGRSVYLDWQVDADVGTDNWTNAGLATQSPIDKIPVFKGGVRRFRYRLRGYTDDATTPPIIRGTNLKGVSRVDFKRQWICQINFGQTAEILSNTGQDTERFLAWLEDISENGKLALATSRLSTLHNRHVLVDPQEIRHLFTSVDGTPNGIHSLVLREV